MDKDKLSPRRSAGENTKDWGFSGDSLQTAYPHDSYTILVRHMKGVATVAYGTISSPFHTVANFALSTPASALPTLNRKWTMLI